MIGIEAFLECSHFDRLTQCPVLMMSEVFVGLCLPSVPHHLMITTCLRTFAKGCRTSNSSSRFEDTSIGQRILHRLAELAVHYPHFTLNLCLNWISGPICSFFPPDQFLCLSRVLNRDQSVEGSAENNNN